MDFKIYAVAVRDLFRKHCAENNYSAEQVTRRVVAYYFDDELTPEAQLLFDDIRGDIQKLRYPPKSARDMTFENKRSLIEWVAGYLNSYEMQRMECLKLFCLTANIAKSFPDCAALEESLFPVRPDVGDLWGYVGFWGEQKRQNIPANSNVKPLKEKLRGRATGIGCEFTVPTELLCLKEDDFIFNASYAVYNFRFYTSSCDTPEWSIFRHKLLDENLAFVGINISVPDKMFVFVDRYSKQSYMARNAINSENNMMWEFMSAVPFFDEYFERKRSAKTKFPLLRPLKFPNMATNYHECTMDGLPFREEGAGSLGDRISDWFYDFKKRLGNLSSFERVKRNIFQLVLDDDVEAFKKAVKDNRSLLNETDDSGNTPLFVAAKYSRDEILDFILEYDQIDIRQKNNYGDDVLSSIRYLGYRSSKKLLKATLKGVTPII